MAYYQLGKVIKMRRTALNYSREDFQTEGPSSMTIYRVEEGKTHATEQTYRSLTRSMGMEESTRQGALKTDNMGMLYLINDISRVFQIQEAEKAEELLSQIELTVDTTVPRNRQYIEWVRAKLQYKQKKITAKEYEEAIRTVLTYTIPNFEKVLLKEWAFHEEELKILLALDNALRPQKRYKEQMALLDVLKEALATAYMNEEQRVKYDIAIRLYHADVLGNLERHREAILENWETYRLCQRFKEFGYLANIQYDIFWNYKKLKEKETLSAREENECRQCLLQAYYVSEIQNVEQDFYKYHLRKYYPEELR